MDFEGSAEERLALSLQIAGLEANNLQIQPILGDLSPRRYFRVSGSRGELKNLTSSSSLMAMVFNSVTPPEAEAKIVRTSDQSYLEITQFFLEKGLPVPLVFKVYKDIGVLLTEDLGDRPLIDLAVNLDSKTFDYYSEAVSLINQIQAIQNKDNFFIFERGFDQGVYLREMKQFEDYVLSPDLSKAGKQVVEDSFNLIASKLASFTKVLVHRDFHSWNLMVDKKDSLRLIDFQDALLGVRCYDLVALLHERDIDKVLSREMILDLEQEFFDNFKDPFLHEVEYPFTQLQRDLKVSGLFVKVKQLRGLDSYSRWVPGTLERIKKTLNLVRDKDKVLKEFEALLIDEGVFS